MKIKFSVISPAVFSLLFCAATLFAHAKNTRLSGLGDTTLLALGNVTHFDSLSGSVEVLHYSAMEYDGRRHRIMAFGGGHATGSFPNEVEEFSFDSLKWHNVTQRDGSCSYTQANALYNSKGQTLGGLKFPDGRIAPSSRHTYDGLICMPDTDVMVLTSQENMGGGNCPTKQLQYYNGGGLFTLDLKTYRWSVREENDVAQLYGYNAINPGDPSWIYIAGSSSSELFKFNWRTGQRIALGGPDARGCCSDFSMEYCPLDTCLYVFVNAYVWRYSISKNLWVDMKPTGTLPDAHGLSVDYDTLNHVFAVFCDSMFYYYSPKENTWRHIQTRLPVEEAYHHLIYDPVDNVHIVVDAYWNTYVYKFSDTPGRFSGTGVENTLPITSDVSLPEAIPNPFNPATTINYAVSKPSHVRVALRDVTGRTVKILSDRQERTGRHSIRWDGTDSKGARVSSGLYLFSLEAEGKALSKSVLLMK